MDNADVAPHRVLDGLGLMDWGKPERDPTGYFRLYKDCGGKYAHAPFILSLPQHIPPHELMIAVDAEIVDSDQVEVQQLVGDSFVPLLALSSNEAVVTAPLLDPGPQAQVVPREAFALSAGAEHLSGLGRPPDGADGISTANDVGSMTAKSHADERSPVEISTFRDFQESNSIYGTQEVVVKSVDLLLDAEKSSRVFELGNTMNMRIELESKTLIKHFVLVVCIYFRDTRAATQLFCTSDKLGLKSLLGREVVDVIFEPLRLGEGEYVASIGVFKKCDFSSAAENEAYCVVDRAVMFKVYQPSGMAKSLGSFAHQVRWITGSSAVDYDPAIEHGYEL
jgi:lipopolysaccharide transport system ATP-binding protein